MCSGIVCSVFFKKSFFFHLSAVLLCPLTCPFPFVLPFLICAAKEAVRNFNLAWLVISGGCLLNGGTGLVQATVFAWH